MGACRALILDQSNLRCQIAQLMLDVSIPYLSVFAFVFAFLLSTEYIYLNNSMVLFFVTSIGFRRFLKNTFFRKCHKFPNLVILLKWKIMNF